MMCTKTGSPTVTSATVAMVRRPRKSISKCWRCSRTSALGRDVGGDLQDDCRTPENSTPRDAFFIATMRSRMALDAKFSNDRGRSGVDWCSARKFVQIVNVPWLAAVSTNTWGIVSRHVLQMDPNPSMNCAVPRRRTQNAKLGYSSESAEGTRLAAAQAHRKRNDQ